MLNKDILYNMLRHRGRITVFEPGTKINYFIYYVCKNFTHERSDTGSLGQQGIIKGY